MKKYKLKKSYPGTYDTKVGDVVEYCELDEFYHTIDNEFPKYEVEDYPEYWEEVVEKKYEILEVVINIHKKVSCVKDCSREYIDALLSCEHNYIHSIRRLSDGEVFSIGDKVVWNWSDSSIDYLIITGFKVSEDDITVKVSDTRFNSYFANLIKTGEAWKFRKYIEPKVVTEDGKKLYVGDTYWYTDKEGNGIVICMTIRKETHISDHNNYVRFSTKELAEQYKESNKVLFITEDGYEIKNYETMVYWIHNESCTTIYPTILNKSWFEDKNLEVRNQYTIFKDSNKAEEFRKNKLAKKNEEKLLDSKVLSINEVVELYTESYSSQHFKNKLKELVKSKQ